MKLRKKLEELKWKLEIAKYRRSRMFPGPGIEEEITELLKEIKKVKTKLKSEKL